jgi:hypothetical protein
MVLGHLLPQKGNCELQLTISSFVLYFGCHIASKFDLQPEGKRLLEVIFINGRIILKCIVKDWVFNMRTACVWL